MFIFSIKFCKNLVKLFSAPLFIKVKKLLAHSNCPISFAEDNICHFLILTRMSAYMTIIKQMHNVCYTNSFQVRLIKWNQLIHGVAYKGDSNYNYVVW